MPTIATRTTDLPSHPRAPYYWTGDGSGGVPAGGLPKRRLIRVSTGNVPSSGIIEGSAPLNGMAGAHLLTVRTSTPSWIRLYASAADRTADSARLVDDPMPSTPLLLDVLFDPAGPTDYPIFDGGQWGTLFFNGDEPAESLLYYRIEVIDPTALASLGTRTIFQQTTFSSASVAIGDEPRWGGGAWLQAKGVRERYYEAFGQLRGERNNTTIATFPNKPEDRNDHTATIGIVRSSTHDILPFKVQYCCYINPDPITLVNGQTRPFLRAGLVRDSGGVGSSTNVVSFVEWLNPDMSGSGAFGGNVPLALGEAATLEVKVFPFGSGATVEIRVDGILYQTQAVPAHLVADAGHDYVGLWITTKEGTSPEIFGGLAVTSLSIRGKSSETSMIFDLGLSPIEQAGGTLTNPPDTTVVP